jgi:hypothetical protein
VALVASLFGLIALGVIIITIRDQSGRETSRIMLPGGSTATVEQSPGGTGTVREAPPSPPESEPAGETGGIAGDRVILAKLERAIPMRYPRETPLESVLNDIRKATAGPDGAGIPIYVDPVGLQEAERTITSPVTIDVEGIPLKTTLGLVLRSLGLDYCVAGGVLYISCIGEGETLAEAVGGFRRTITDGSRESAAVMAKLGAPIPVRFLKETPLDSVCKYITDATRGPNSPGIPVFADPIGLQEAERTITSPVVIDIEGVPLRTTLQLMLGQLGLTYYVEKGLLKITADGDEFVPEWLVKQAEKNKPAPNRFDALLARVAPGLKLSARAIGPFERSWPALRTHRGRENVLRTEPVSRAIPFVMSCPVAVPAGRKTTLFLEVSWFLGDWNLVVKANNRTLHDSIIKDETTKDGWAAVEVDLTGYAGSTVNLEILDKANELDGGRERAYWARIEILSEAATGGALDKGAGRVGAEQKRVQEPLSRPAREAVHSFHPLFNGKDLTGWKDLSVNKPGWKVEAGLLIGRTDTNSGVQCLTTDRADFSDFRLKVRIKNTDDNHKLRSIAIRSSFSDTSYNGYLIVVGGNGFSRGTTLPVGTICKADNRPHNWVISWNVLAEPVPIAVGEWYDFEVTAIGNQITTWVNGRKVAEYVDGAGPFASGAITLTYWRTSIQYKYILIDEFPRERRRAREP